jgi:exonuclease SbcC
MRILAIRGKNLASLRGEFEMRLDQPPISSCNLFSISGPTGSGKSTLLDALCLALYGKTPRLSDKGGHAIGAPGEDEKLRLNSNDTRALLSRGTADGFAEVDFQGADGKRYQATWRVHRARNLGRFQNQTMALVDLDSGDTLSSQITEVRQAIETRVGFTFEEFKRTVLLPQFEFTNFLRAIPNERAKILEHVMGGEIFTKLSMAAHERAASERDKLNRLQDKLGTLRTLSQDDRAQLDVLAATTTQALTEAQATMAQAGRDLAWHEQHAVLVAAVELATSALSDAEQCLALAEPREKEIQAVSAAQLLRATRDAAAKAAIIRDKAKAALSETRLKLEQASLDLKNAKQAFGKAESELRVAREHEATLRPQIDEAKRLDSQIDPARRTAEIASAECKKLRGLVEQGQSEVKKLAKAITEGEAERFETEQWLATHITESRLSAEWPRWQSELQKHAALGQELGTIATKLATAEESATIAGRACAQSAELASEAEKQFKTAQTHWQETEAALGGHDLAALRARASGFRNDLDKLADLAAIVERALSAQEASATARAQATAFRAAEERLRLEATRLAGELDGCRLRTTEARFAVDTTRSALSFDEQRALLKDGQACPLCGSADHPYAHGSLSSTALDGLEERVRELERLGRELQDSRSTTEAAQAVAHTNACSAENSANESVAETERALHDYHSQVASLALDLPASATEARAALKVRIEQAQTQCDQAERDEQCALDLASERDRAREGLDCARSKWSAAGDTHAGHVKQEQEMTAMVGRLVEDRTRLANELDGIETLLSPVMSWQSDWVVAARQKPEGFLENCQGRAQQFEACQRRLATAVEKLTTLRASHETSRVLLDERQANLESSTTAMQEQENALTALQEQRMAILQGRAALDVETELKALSEKATNSLETARQAHTGAGTALAIVQAAEEAALKRLHEADQEAAHDELALDVALAKLGMDRQKLEERLVHNETWIAHQRKDLEAIRAAVTRALATRDDRQRGLDEHSAKDRPEGDRESTQVRVANARAQVDNLGQELIGLRAKQQQDNDQKTSQSSAKDDVRAQEQASRIWEQLDEVIGSADGKKFRVFAQSLAFDALLSEANAHLADLAPRYRLMSVPGAELELQVADQDLGSEVRTINSLSGGEIFLVSLALALGLSGISTRATQAQTLFIDEGFGTLDRDTLDHAMVALENLQATGRTVGIISHVPELQERFGAQVRVVPAGCGKSRVVVVGA